MLCSNGRKVTDSFFDGITWHTSLIEMIKKGNRKKEFPSVHEIEMSGNLGFISIVGQHLNVRIDIAVGNHYFVPFRERDGYKGRVRRRQLYSRYRSQLSCLDCPYGNWLICGNRLISNPQNLMIRIMLLKWNIRQEKSYLVRHGGSFKIPEQVTWIAYKWHLVVFTLVNGVGILMLQLGNRYKGLSRYKDVHCEWPELVIKVIVTQSVRNHWTLVHVPDKSYFIDLFLRRCPFDT